MSTRRNVLKLLAGAAIVGGVAGSIHVLAEARAVAQTNPPATDRIALKGYDPVAYFTLSTPTAGVAEYNHVYDGVRYYFANSRHRDMFKASPDKYAPQFGGLCAMNLSNGVKRESDPHNWVISNGNLYVFAGERGMQNFTKAPAEFAAKAAAQLNALKASATQ